MGVRGEQRVVAGTVIELLPSWKCRVELDNRRRVVAHPAAAARLNFVRLRPGDQVAVALSPHDQTRGRILRLLEPGRDRKGTLLEEVYEG